jgi:hypothetical protein
VLVIAFTVPFLLGVVLVRPRFCRHDVPRLLLGLPVGMGLVSACFFLSLITGVPSLVWELSLLAGAGALWVRRRRDACVFCGAIGETSNLERLCGAVFLAVLAAAMTAFLFESSRAPHGQWDAWSIYNLRARYLYGREDQWRSAFSAVLHTSHPDYPLLLPAFIARAWRYLAVESTAAPVAVAFVFTFSTVGLLAGGVAVLGRRIEGWLAGLLLLGTPYFVIHGASQYADVPLAFFILATLILLSLQDLHRGRSGPAALAGLCAGLAAWTKNEGLLFAAAVTVARLMVLRRDPKRLRAELPLFAAGLAPVLGLVFYFRHTLAPPNYFLSSGGTLGRALDFWRYMAVADGFARHLWNFGQFFVTPFLFAAAYVALVQPDFSRRPASFFTAAVALVLVAAGYFMVYVVSPADLTWLMATSLDRLLLQLWPAVILTAFLAAKRLD